jgi:hypothetical protein
MATVCGLDNREMLPPYFPVGRNEDGIFGAIVHRCCPHAYFAHLPLSLLHFPPKQQVYSRSWVKTLAIPRLCDAILCSVASFDRFPYEQETRIQIAQLGFHLRALARMPLDDLNRLVGALWRRVVAARLVELDRRMVERRTAPEFWRTVAENCARALQGYLRAGDAARDIGKSTPSGVSLGKLLDLYGRLLISWECLLKAARTLDPEKGHLEAGQR